VKADRGERVTQNLGEKVYAIIDALIAIGKELKASPASVALAWVQGRPGVASTIIGARRMDQLEQNLAALDITLTADQIARLDKLSKPTLGFPMPFLNVASTFSQGGTTVNGEKSVLWPLAPKTDAERY
jgi:aryl-alcohol dehydrogenase-like predicted oxidoreductase